MKRASSLLMPVLCLLLPSCDTAYHARVEWHPRRTLGPRADYATQPVFVEPAVLPSTHSGFIYWPSYPKTLSVWKEESLLKEEGTRRIVIDLASQRGMLYVNGQVALDFPVCTGTADKPTPRGSFAITQKSERHHSNIYHVEMPYFMRLTNDGIGLHVGYVARQPASHGCIRVPREACKLLFRQARLGTPVEVR